MMVGVKTFDVTFNFIKPIKRLMRSEERQEYMALSTKTNGLAVSIKALKNIPDVREDKIKEVKEQLNSGMYNISMDKLCDKILGYSL